MPTSRPSLWAALSLGCAIALATPPAHANEALRPALADMSKQVAKLLKGRGQDAIAIGAFTGPAHLPASSGPGIKQVLIEELTRQGVKVQSRAGLEIKGDYREKLDPDTQVLELRLRATVLDDKGDQVIVLDKTIEDFDLLARVLGVNRPDPGAGLTPQKESQELKQLIDHPAAVVRDARVRTSPGSPYAVEVLVQEGQRYVPRNPTTTDGLAYVGLKKGEAFAVRLVNDSDYDAAVELTLDGLSVFAFSDTKGYRHFIVPKKGSALIKGWHRTNEHSDAFLITDYARGAAAELLTNSDGIGTITASFAAAWEPKAKPPEDEGAQFRDPCKTAVGRGEPVKTPYQEVRREHGRVRDIISVRYQRPER